jgi:hypothetical protein
MIARMRTAMNRSLAVGAILTVMTVGTAIGTAFASAATTQSWAFQNTPSPGGVGGQSFGGVKCTSAASCVAVGSAFANNNVQYDIPIIEVWNGQSWSQQSSPIPPLEGAGGEAALNDISCTSSNNCMAVGEYQNLSLLNVTLAEHWNGTSWRIQPTPSPAAGSQFSYLLKVSCGSPSMCIAVGEYDGTGAAVLFTELWNGTKWKMETQPISGLWDVSCVSSTACTGVIGSKVEFWNGTKWSVQTVPKPGGTKANFSAVTCLSVSDCTAVGTYGTTTPKLFAEYWNGTIWTLQLGPRLTAGGITSVSLGSLSCTSAVDCTAVGSAYSASAPGGVMMAQYWNGTKWSLDSLTPISNTFGQGLSSVSCSSTATCTAVGTYQPADSSYPNTIALRSS